MCIVYQAFIAAMNDSFLIAESPSLIDNVCKLNQMKLNRITEFV